MRMIQQSPFRVPLLSLLAGGTTAVVAFGAGVALAIARNNPVGIDLENPRLVYVERALDHEIGSMLFVSLALGLFSTLYLTVRSRRWHKMLHPVRMRDAGLVGLLNIAGIIMQSVLAYVVGRAYQGPTLGIMLHLLAAVAANALVYEHRFRQLAGSGSRS